MDKKTFRIRGCGPGLDGLYVETGGAVSGSDDQLIQIDRISNLNIMIGDRNLSIQLPVGAMWMAKRHLEDTTEVAVREFDSSSGFGAFLDQKTWSGGPVVFNVARYETTISVSASSVDGEKIRTITSFYLHRNLSRCWSTILDLSKRIDQTDVVFELEALRDWETNNEFNSNDGE